MAEASNNGSAELFESCLVRLNCVQFMTVPTTNFTGETNYTVTDGTTTLVVRVPTTTTPVIGTTVVFTVSVSNAIGYRPATGVVVSAA